jgi:hypothetical protein
MRIQERDVSVELPNNSRAVVRFVRAGSRRNSFNTYTLEVAALRGPGVVDLRGSILTWKFLKRKKFEFGSRRPMAARLDIWP